MQLSYKIIKNNEISYGKKGISVADINTNSFIEQSPEEKVDTPVEEFLEEVVDIDKIKEEIREQLHLENEKIKQTLIEDIMQKTKEEAERLKKEAIARGYKEGLSQGYERGIDSCKDECSQMKKAALDMLKQAEEEVKSYFKDNKARIIQFAGDIAESIVNTTIDLSSENILLLIKPIIQQYEKNENIIITCHPTKVELLKSKTTELEDLSHAARLIILSDENLEENGCIIENENQIIDLEVKKQINSIIMEIKNLED